MIKAPKRWVSWLRKRGLEVWYGNQNWILECQQCGGRWWLSYKPGGGFYRGYWKCPHYGCNEPE